LIRKKPKKKVRNTYHKTKKGYKRGLLKNKHEPKKQKEHQNEKKGERGKKEERDKGTLARKKKQKCTRKGGKGDTTPPNIAFKRGTGKSTILTLRTKRKLFSMTSGNKGGNSKRPPPR